jgi:tetratricopeptide (TPR) repeat protein
LFFLIRWKAKCLKELESFEEAMVYYNLALEIAPKDQYKKLQNQLAICFKAEGMKLNNEKKYSDAIESFDKAIDTCAADYEDRYSLLWWKSEALKELGVFEQSKNFLEQAYNIAPKEKRKEIHNQKAIVFKKEGIELSKEKKYDEALAKFNDALEISSEDFDQKYSLTW